MQNIKNLLYVKLSLIYGAYETYFYEFLFIIQSVIVKYILSKIQTNLGLNLTRLGWIIIRNA